MKLKFYAEAILKLALHYPDAEVVYSCDDEGDRFSFVNYEPTTGKYYEDESEFDSDTEGSINAVCVN